MFLVGVLDLDLDRDLDLFLLVLAMDLLDLDRDLDRDSERDFDQDTDRDLDRDGDLDFDLETDLDLDLSLGLVLLEAEELELFDLELDPLLGDPFPLLRFVRLDLCSWPFLLLPIDWSCLFSWYLFFLPLSLPLSGEGDRLSLVSRLLLLSGSRSFVTSCALLSNSSDVGASVIETFVARRFSTAQRKSMR